MDLRLFQRPVLLLHPADGHCRGSWLCYSSQARAVLGHVDGVARDPKDLLWPQGSFARAARSAFHSRDDVVLHFDCMVGIESWDSTWTDEKKARDAIEASRQYVNQLH